VKELHSVSDVAFLVGVTRQTVWRWVVRGRLPAVKIGCAYAIAEANVERLLRVRGELAKLKAHPFVRRARPRT